MFRLWAKLIKENRLLKDTTIENDSKDTRTHKIFQALDDVCIAFDLGKPIWLKANVNDSEEVFAKEHGADVNIRAKL